MNSRLRHSNDTHPADAALDRLRAGLLDREPATRDALHAHLRECRVCQERAGLWSRATEVLDQGATERGLAGRLDARRQRALRGVSTASRRRTPIAFALAAAVTAVAIGLGVFVMNDRDDPDATVVTATAQSPDLYDNIDFYLWLMEKHASEDASPNS
jgi:hypothetical protein